MKRVFLFLATNLAIIVLLGFMLRLLGLESVLDAQGVDLDLGNIFHNSLSWFFAESNDQVGTWGVETDHERGRILAEVLDLEARRLAGIGERVRCADQAFVVSHSCKSMTLATQARGASAFRVSGGCAP